MNKPVRSILHAMTRNLPAAIRHGATQRRWHWILGLATLFIALPAGIQVNGVAILPSPSEKSHAVERRAIAALGWLEPSSNIVKLAAPATVEASRIARLEVEEGDFVEKDQVVAVLDVAAKLKAQLKAAEAQVALKQVLAERVRLDTEATIVSRRMAVARAEADLAQAESELSRQRTLVDRQFATASNLEKRMRDAEVARAQLEEARGALRRLETLLPVDVTTNAPIDIVVAKRELAAAEADLAHTRVLLDQASIRSPIRGRVLAVNTRPGEKISADGVLELGATDTMVAIAEVYQTDIGVIRVGQPVELKSVAFSQPVQGTVARIGMKVKRQSVVNNDPATDTDARVLEIRIAIDPEYSNIVAGLTRLQVRAYFKLGAQ